MPFNATWAIDDHIILVQMYGVPTDKEIGQIDAHILTSLDKANGCCLHVIVDFSDVDEFPINLTHALKIFTHSRHSHAGWTILVGAPTGPTLLANAISQLPRSRLIAKVTVDEAVRYLRSVDENIP
ncbi:MAG: hypothetical protein L0154_03430 [Chloroflexi bacterium]|nr:hypothetical protein [Chloroflexota bacterium]